MRKIEVWAIALITALLSGCVSFDTEPLTGTEIDLSDQQKLDLWQSNQNQLSRIKSWNLRGKMGVKTGSKGGSATLKWRYAGDNQDIELYGPFGGGRVIIKVDPDGAELRDTKGKTINGETASEVLFKRLGWHVPFDHLSNWARGLPGEGASDIKLDDEGRLVYLIQDNWEVEYEDYQSIENTLEKIKLPTKLTVSALPGTIEVYSKKGEYLGDDLRVKVILKRWWGIETES